MALSRNCVTCFSFVASVVFLVSTTLLHTSAGGNAGTNNPSMDNGQLRMMTIGSRPPTCLNKCMSCRPCMATLVIPPEFKTRGKFVESSHVENEEDNGYYHLSWKCMCKNKLYQP